LVGSISSMQNPQGSKEVLTRMGEGSESSEKSGKDAILKMTPFGVRNTAFFGKPNSHVVAALSGYGVEPPNHVLYLIG